MLLEYLKNAGLLSLLVLPFSLYLNLKKIGYKVAASYSWRGETFTASGIGTITLINMKDSPLAIFSIHAVVEKFSINLKEFNPPLILKAMEAVNVEADTVSKRYIGNDVFEWKDSFDQKHRIDIYLSTAHKTIKCRRHQGPSTQQFSFANKHGLRLITTSISRFNDRIYNDNAKYAITYMNRNAQHTALVHVNGIID